MDISAYPRVVQNTFLHVKKSGVPSFVEHSDLLNSGYVAYLEALSKYDESVSDNPDAFAFYRVRGAMLDEIRSHYHISHHHKDLQMFSLDDPDEDFPEQAEYTIDSVEDYIFLSEVINALRRLPKRQRQLIIGLFFKEKTSRDFVKLWNISEGRVSQIRKYALDNLRKYLK
jgi:RNA polymerase sigma factor (sigma-70 family)